MRNRLMSLMVVLAAGLALPSIAAAQVWPQSDLPKDQTGKNQPFDPHDLSGVWQMAPGGGGEGPGKEMPPLTEWGQAKYDQNKPGYGPKAAPGGNDPLLQCDPMGFPRILFIITPVEIVQIPGRTLMFFDWQHTLREIWTDGRELPKDPDPNWYGYSVGHWEGDTFVVETIGLNDKTWLGAQGQPHSEDMRVTERYRRIDHDTMEFSITMDDPKTYTKSWGDPRIFRLRPHGEISESFCVHSEEEEFEKRIRMPAAKGETK